MPEPPPSAPLSRHDLTAGLRRLGVTAGMGVMVHSSLKSFGNVEGGAFTVITALMETVTDQGTIMMPSFNHGSAFGEGASGTGVYDPRVTPTTDGTIPDAFWRLPGVYRSLAPTHAYAAWGRHARRYTENHHRTITMGPDSPLGLLWRDGGYGLFLGTTYRTNSFHHVPEAVLGSPCLGVRTEAYPVRLPDGRMVQGRTWSWRERPCPLTDQTRYAAEMTARGLHVQGNIGPSACTLFKLDDCYQLLMEVLQQGREGFPPCRQCPIRPVTNRFTVLSDWDPERQAPRKDSEA